MLFDHVDETLCVFLAHLLAAAQESIDEPRQSTLEVLFDELLALLLLHLVFSDKICDRRLFALDKALILEPLEHGIYGRFLPTVDHLAHRG